MSHMSRSQEREERTKMGRGMLTSVFALFFCWVPILGIVLGSIGFIRIVTRVTRQFRTRFVVYLTASILILALCIGVLLGEIWIYSGNPNILSDTGMWLFQKVTGQTSLPIPTEAPIDNYMGGMDYSGMENPGMGLDDSLYHSSGGMEIEGMDAGDMDGADAGDMGGTEEGGESMEPDAKPDMGADAPGVG